MKLSLLRSLLMLDAAILFLLGALLIFAPNLLENAFGFSSLPPAVNYLIGLWGCLFATTGIGYVIAATNPLRHLVWVQIGVARGAIECAVGLFYATHGIVTFRQASFGIFAAALISVAYLVLYPRRPRLVSATGAPLQPAPSVRS
jgi:hypothetical protein